MTMGGDVLAPAGTLPRSAHLARQTSLHPRTPTRLLHVIANQCAHWCGNPRPRRETRQAGTTSGKSAALSRIRPKYYFLLCPAARSTDCHVAPLLAMTCCNMHLSAWQGRFPSGKFVALFRIPQASPPLQPRTPTRLLHVIANQCAHWCGNPFSPQRSLASWLLFGQIRDALRMRPKYYFLLRPAAGEADCHVAALLAMTMGGTSLHPPARSRVPHTLRAKHPCTRAHVLPSACHCEPVRTLVWQSASPQGKLTSWQYFGRIRTHLRIRPKFCSYYALPQGYGLPRRFAPRNDNGGDVLAPAGTLPRAAHLARQTSLHPRTRPSFCMSLRTSAHTGVAIRVPAEKPGKLAAVWANS